MSLSSLIHSLISHNELVIQWLIVLIIGLVSYLAARSLFKKPVQNHPVAQAADLGSSQIEEMLNRLLEKTAKWDAPPAAASSPPGDGVPLEELDHAKRELAQLKSALLAKEAELKNALSKAGSSSAPAGSGEASKELAEKVAELEAKLAEYEILEDDIADLSLYKEENTRLKSEVERLKGGGDPSFEEGPTVPQPDNSEDLVKEFAEAVGKDTRPPEPEPAAVETPAEVVAAPAVSEEEEVSPLAAEEEGFKASPLPDVDPGEERAALETQSAVDDLFAELASSDLDTDKVALELAAIEGMDSASAEDVLGEGLDADKMAAEADELKS